MHALHPHCVHTQESYAHAFGAIRQLAVSLRGALNMKSQEAYKQVRLGG
jgi:hypothetical protein